ncbi:MAG: hypothetical protein ACK5WZ_11375 [Pseudobdellovibrionaceae bacterium]
MRNNRWVFSLMVFFLGSAAWAQTPALLPFQGRLTDSFGNNVNYTVTVNFRMYPPAGSCYIYEETQTVTPNELGLFSVLLGDSSYKTYPAGPLAFEKVFNNSVSNTLVDSCSGMYTPALNDWRRIQVIVNGTSLPDMQTIASSPYALHSNFLGGKTASEFIQVSGNTTQTNVNTLTSGNDASSLHNHDSIYARIDSGNNFVGPITSSSGLYASGSSGTVGIGTTSTLADLHIRKNTPSFRMEMNAGSAGNGTIDFFSGSSQRASIRASETTNQLVFQTGSTTALTLDQNQNANFAGNLMTNGFLSMGRYTNAQQISLRDTYLIPCGFGCLGTVWTNSTDNSMNYWNGTTIMTVPKFSPVSYVAGGLVVSSNSELSVLAPGGANQVLGMNSAGTAAEYKTLTAGSGVTISNAAGSVTINATVTGSTLNNGQVWVGNGSNQAAARNLLKTDIKSSVAGNWFTASSACAAGTALNFDSVTDTVSCQALSLTSSQVTTALAYSPVNRAGDSMTGNLSTSGQIRSSQNTVAVGATVDFNTGNTQVLSAPGGSTITLNNMQDGGSYTLVITDTTSRTYSFANCTSTRWAPAAASTSGQTVFSILRVTIASTVTCYISWISGF